MPDHEQRTNQTAGGSGVAAGAPRDAPLTHFYATRLPDVGDVVLGVTRELDVASMAPRQLELRAFRADSPRRAALPRMEPEDLLVTEGGLAYVRVDLAAGRGGDFPFDDVHGRIARLTDLRLAGITAEERAGHIGTGLAEWVRVTLESELLFASFYEIIGEGRAVRPPLGEVPDGDTEESCEDFLTWGADWLSAHDYEVQRDAPRSFRKVLIASLHHPAAAANGGDGDGADHHAHDTSVTPLAGADEA